jgi:hypothetical protein
LAGCGGNDPSSLPRDQPEGTEFVRGAGGWTGETSGTSANLLAANGPVIVGENGTVLRYDSGRWSPEDLDRDDHFNAVWYGAADINTVWICGSEGTLLRNPL